MTNNPVVEEVHRIREQILARYGNDLEAYAKDLQRRTEEAARAGRTVLSPNPTTHPNPHPSPAKRVG